MEVEIKNEILKNSSDSEIEVDEDGQREQVGGSSDIGDIEAEELEVIDEIIEVLDSREKK